MFCSACAGALPHHPPVTCPACGAQHWRNPKPCAGALLTHDGKLLMLRRAHEPWFGHWDIPGGFCDVGEHPIAAARRELREEVGLDVRVTGLLGMWIDEYDPAADLATQQATLNIYYHAVPAAGIAVQLDPAEVAEVGWFDPDELPESIAFPGHIRKVLAAWREAFRGGRTVTPLPDRPR